ncbi:hypothetical protein GCM10023116_30090 [Kistimonas scapharcae]|uniref:Chromosome partition protein MukF n=1 Tax=Kistimonas scapharcae TaxID=1036133 RepID=A0ABP8V468_9GAMM
MAETKDIPHLVSEIITAGLQLQLQPADLAFLAALHFWKDQESQPEFGEDELHVVYEVIDRTQLDSSEETRRQRCNHVIRRFLDQHLLLCLEGSGQRAHAYLLTPMAEQIVESVCSGFDASRTALSTLFMTVNSHLREIRDAAETGGNEPFWRLQVEAPLEITVRQLVTTIDHRQRQLDREAVDTRKTVVAMLKQDWQDAISRCETLLEDTQERLQDLQQLLLANCQEARRLLESIAATADSAGRNRALDAITRLEQHLDRIEHWSGERLEHWEGFHLRAHQYLRQFINMDERKALSERLLDALKRYRELPWSLNTIAAEPLPRLREIEPPPEQRVTARIILDEESVIDSDDQDSLRREISLWLDAVTASRGTLPTYEEAMSELAGRYPLHRLFSVAGWLFEAMTERGSARHHKQVPETRWHPIVEDLEVESLSLTLRQPAHTTATEEATVVGE